MGQERQRLQEILMQNHRELLELSTTTTPDDKKDLHTRFEQPASSRAFSMCRKARVWANLRLIDTFFFSLMERRTTKNTHIPFKIEGVLELP